MARRYENEQVRHSRDLDKRARDSNVARGRVGKDTADNRPPFLCNTVALTGDIIDEGPPFRLNVTKYIFQLMEYLTEPRVK